MVVKINSNNFESEVLSAESPVLVDFYADWCGPCKMSAPHVEAVSEEFSDKVKVTKINIDESPELAAKYGVMSIPTFLVIEKGEVKAKSVGAKNKEELVELLGI